jgi:hypothetical protein
LDDSSIILSSMCALACPEIDLRWFLMVLNPHFRFQPIIEPFR